MIAIRENFKGQFFTFYHKILDANLKKLFILTIRIK